MLHRMAFLGALVIGAGALAAPPIAERSDSGATLVVPATLARAGTVYHALPGRDRQIYFESDAPLEDIKGQSNQVIGFAVAGPASNPAALRGGEWHLPVDSIRTGIQLRDEHLAGKDWLDAASHPDIVFQLEEVRQPSLTKDGAGYRTYEGALVGEMTIHGVTNPITITGATITLLDASDRTAKVAPGDLMLIRATYSVTLRDYEVSHPVIGDKVAETIEITTTLYLSTTPPSGE